MAKYPKLTEIGSLRRAALTDEQWRNLEDDPNGDGGMYGGSYTADQIKDVIKYAEERFVTIVPEIEMPGHVQAAVVAYPELSCKDGRRDLEVWTDWGVNEEALCVCHESAIRFMEDVLDEVADTFPGTYVHVGACVCVCVRVCVKEAILRFTGASSHPGECPPPPLLE